MIYQVLGTIEDYHQIFKVILAGLTIILCVGVYKLVNNQYTHWVNRYFILFYENIQVLNLLGIFMLFNGLDKKSIPLTFLGLVVYLLCAILIFLSGIRTMMVAAVGSLIATLLMRFRFKVKNFLVLLIIILLISSLLFLAYQKVSTIASQASSGSISRLQNISFKNTDLSIIFRLISFQSAFNTAIANPIIGIGFPSEYYMEILGIRYSTNTIDNSYIRLAMGGGFLLLIFYIYLLIVLYKSSFQLIRRVHKGRDGVLALSLFSVIVLANLADCSETNISYVRVMPVIAFAWAGLVKLRETIYDTAYRH
jgi:O-antigen ligase